MDMERDWALASFEDGLGNGIPEDILRGIIIDNQDLRIFVENDGSGGEHAHGNACGRGLISGLSGDDDDGLRECENGLGFGSGVYCGETFTGGYR